MAKTAAKQVQAQADALTKPNVLLVYAKAVIGFLVALSAVIGTWATVALADNHVSGQEWVALIVAGLGVIGTPLGIAITTNAPNTTTGSDETGTTTLGLILFVVAVAFLISIGIAASNAWLLIFILAALLFLLL